jgi:hypothetical protein
VALSCSNWAKRVCKRCLSTLFYGLFGLGFGQPLVSASQVLCRSSLFALGDLPLLAGLG